MNRYPGVRTDSEYSYYSFSFSKEVRDEWTWTERYPSGEEVLSYLNFVADRLDLRRDIRLNTRVESAVYDEDANTWTVHLKGGGTLTTKYLVSGMGVLSQPIFPEIPGIETFRGEKYHTPPSGRGKASTCRASASGSSDSGIRHPDRAGHRRQVDEFFVFQRTPNFIVETNNDKVSEEDMAWLRENYDLVYEKAANPPFGVAMEPAEHSALEVSEDERRRIFESKWNEGGFHFANECFNDLATNHEASELASEFIRTKIAEIVKDPETAELLSPRTYSFNGKRVPTGHGYYAAFNHDHVHLIDTAETPITAITEKGVKVGDTEYELDVLIFATGFDAMTGTLTHIDIVGREVAQLREKWAETDSSRTSASTRTASRTSSCRSGRRRRTRTSSFRSSSARSGCSGR